MLDMAQCLTLNVYRVTYHIEHVFKFYAFLFKFKNAVKSR